MNFYYNYIIFAVAVPKTQFLAIEIARNREGFNDGLRETFCKKKTASS